MADICPPEINREKRKKKDTEKKREEEIKIEQNARTSFGRYKNVFVQRGTYRFAEGVS